MPALLQATSRYVLTSSHEACARRDQAIAIVRRIPSKTLIVTATTPRDTAKAIEKLAPLASPLGVKLAIDSASMRPIESAVHFVEDGVDANVGIALDFADAARGGD